jgi:alginate O-acetyltransferase complex protein AlgJ
VYPGREGWAFYRQDVEYLTRPGFLDPDRLQRRIERAAEWNAPPEPDPRKAIVQLKRDLDERGITLIVMPTPVKPGVHPERLVASDGTHAAVLQNPSYKDFVADLERGGVLVFDAAGPLAEARSGEPQYLATDTHWRPETMEAIAASLGDFVTTHGGLPEVADPEYRIERTEHSQLGDTARMLDLPDGSTLFAPESVWLRRVLYQDGSLWRSSRDADVLLLGDSFSNMYSLESMGWGTSAGFAEQLSFVLRRPVDRLVQNDQGSFATRAMLQGDPERLKGKRVVVYQFAVRELTDGDWKVLPLPVPES